MRGIHRWPVNSPHKGPATRKMFPFDDVTMVMIYSITANIQHAIFGQTRCGYPRTIPDSKVYVANMGPIWIRQDPGGSHVVPMNFAIWDVALYHLRRLPHGTEIMRLVKLTHEYGVMSFLCHSILLYNRTFVTIPGLIWKAFRQNCLFCKCIYRITGSDSFIITGNMCGFNA